MIFQFNKTMAEIINTMFVLCIVTLLLCIGFLLKRINILEQTIELAIIRRKQEIIIASAIGRSRLIAQEGTDSYTYRLLVERNRREEDVYNDCLDDISINP